VSYSIPAAPYCSNRRIEWHFGLIMASQGVLALWTEYHDRAPPQLAFRALLDLGLGAPAIGFGLLIAGLFRMYALYRNGTWQRGPIVRAGCAVVGMAIWGQLLYGIIDVYMKTGAVYLTLGVWGWMVVFEYISYKQALSDIRARKPRRDQIARPREKFNLNFISPAVQAAKDAG
jgi:hypothetical protein